MKFNLRPANQSDQSKIRQIVRQVGINPFGLDWRRFILAVTPDGEIIGIGQIKIYRDQLQELASIGVRPEYQGEGVAHAIIDYLINASQGSLYLTCQNELEPLYSEFGFRIIYEDEMPVHFLRIQKLANLFCKLFRRRGHLLVMLLER